MDLVPTKPVWVSHQVMLKPVSSATETSYVENLLEESLDMVCSKMRITKALISLRGCAGWSAPLLFANSEDRFSHVEAHIALDNMHFCLRKPVFGPHSTVGIESNCRYRGPKFDPSPVPYFHGD